MTASTLATRELDEARPVPPAAGTPPGRPGRGRNLLRGRPQDPAWVRPCLLALLAGTALLYLWGLGASGWANSFYSAAVQAGTQSWKSFFFGSFDSSNFITVDKAPAALWVMELSARVFGVNSWSILVPEALEGVAAVGVLYLAVRRWFSAGSALLAGAILALTPVAALMFRFNNPDAMLVLLLVAGAYAMIRALEHGSTRWLLFAFALVGFGFLAKMLQTFMVVPAFGLVYLMAAPVTFWRRIWQLVLACVTLVVAASWWVAIVELTPASARPYVGGSQNNSLLNLIFGYNGFGRLTGNETGSVGGGGGAGGNWGPTGLTRMFGAEFGTQISWLLPAALILLVAGLVWRWRYPRTDRVRAAFVLWGAWLLVTGLAFSLGKGIIHPYYSVALAPAIGALVGMGAGMLWKRRHDPAARVVLAATLVVTAWWAYKLLDRSPDWAPWLRTVVLVGGLLGAGLLLFVHQIRGRAGVFVAVGVITIALAAPAGFALSTARTTHSGAIPTAGPAGTGGFGFGGGGFAGRFPQGIPNGVGAGGLPGGGGFGGGGGGGAGGGGGLLNGSSPTAALTKVLAADAGKYTWIAATVGANEASGYQLATNDPVMAIGGFNGTDPTPTLAQFEAYVRAGKIHYFIAGGGFGGFAGGGFGRGGGFGGSTTASTSSAIRSWVEANFTGNTVGGVTLYDLTAPRS
jgi:4-amino-4-deoxy-L-arabinose transferase-like glycosyltransferase